MIHLFLGLPSKFIREFPYNPASTDFPILNLNQIFKNLKFGKLYCIPSIANYLGGDLVSGLLACNLHRKDNINILLDIGTNGEIIIGNKDWGFVLPQVEFDEE